ncbi:glycosyl hydrolase [Flavobacteriales bacterium]|nr:glycosyl hydrolase [Flavobacteriales bacterium]
MKNILLIFILSFFAYLLPAQEINPDIYGFATSNTFTYCDINDTSFTNKVLKINPQVLRFPGGAMGNFYHFNKNGYGFDFVEIEKFAKGSRFIQRSEALNRANIKKGHTQDYIDDFIKLVKLTDAKVVLVANMFVDNDDIIKMISKMKSHNLAIIGVELGSELSNRTFYLNGYTIDEYIEDAEDCSDKIKKYYPQLRTAIVAAPLHSNPTHRHSVWNEKLSEMDFYNDIIVHSYAKVIKGKKEYGQMLTVEPEGDSQEEAFEIYKERTLKFLNEDFPNEIAEYNKIFNKPIWITEWNLQISKTTGNTLLQSFFVAQYFLELMSNSDLKNVTLTTYHNMGGRDYGGSIFRNNKEVLEIQSTYYPLTFLGEIFKNNIVRVEKNQFNNIFTYHCFDESDNIIISYDIDWDFRHFRLNFKDITKIYSSNNFYDKVNLNGVFNLKTDLKIKY